MWWVLGIVRGVVLVLGQQGDLTCHVPDLAMPGLQVAGATWYILKCLRRHGFFCFGACRKLHLKQRDCVQHRNDTANSLQFLFNPWIWKQTFRDLYCAISASRIHWLDLLKRHLITASIWRQPCGLCTVDWTCEEFNSLNYQLACRQKQGEKGKACAACSASTWQISAKGLLALHCSALFARGTFRALEI